MLTHENGETMSDAAGQDYLRKSLARHGKIVLAANYTPAIGEIQIFAGLPLRVVRYATKEEYQECIVFPGDEDEVLSPQDCYFVVEVAD